MEPGTDPYRDIAENKSIGNGADSMMSLYKEINEQKNMNAGYSSGMSSDFVFNKDDIRGRGNVSSKQPSRQRSKKGFGSSVANSI